MKKVTKKAEGIQFIRNDKGNVEFVVVSAKNKEIIDLLEDYGLGLSMNEASEDEIYNKNDALNHL